MLYPQIDDQIMNCDPLIDDLSTLTKSDLVWRGLNLANWTFMDYVIGENKGVCNLISGINIFSCFFFFFVKIVWNRLSDMVDFLLIECTNYVDLVNLDKNTYIYVLQKKYRCLKYLSILAHVCFHHTILSLMKICTIRFMSPCRK